MSEVFLEAENLLKFGTLGLCFLLAVLNFFLIRKLKGNTHYIFSVFCLVCIFFLGYLELEKLKIPHHNDKDVSLEKIAISKDLNGKNLISPLYKFSLTYPEGLVFTDHLTQNTLVGSFFLGSKGSIISIQITNMSNVLPMDFEEKYILKNLKNGVLGQMRANNGVIESVSDINVMGGDAWVVDFKQAHENEYRYRKVIIPSFERKVIYEFTMSSGYNDFDKSIAIFNKIISTFRYI
ncbi:hypothetical protein ACU6DI_004118 [Vibrio navarrensis]